MSATSIPQEKSEKRSAAKISWNGIKKSFLSPFLVTAFAAILLAIFLMPFLYMIFTSLEYSNPGIYSGSTDLAGKEPHLYLSWTEHQDIHAKGKQVGVCCRSSDKYE